MLFVDRLFRALESETYVTGRDCRTPSPEATPPPSSGSQPSKSSPTRPGPPAGKSQSLASRSSSLRDGTQTAASLSGSERSGGERGRAGGGRRHTEDPRSREVTPFISRHLLHSLFPLTMQRVYEIAMRNSLEHRLMMKTEIFVVPEQEEGEEPSVRRGS